MAYKGRVYLVGAGPGDEELLTIKGKRLLENADVVIYDRLANPKLLELAPKAELIDVGKVAGDHKVPQERINEIILEHALNGKKVVRLKGGDPFLFGRGGEELELLVKNNVGYEVVPGITSPIAAAAYGGIPVTHRDYTSSLHIITGYGKRNTKANIDFDSLVKLKGTLVFMMSVSRAEFIKDGLLKAGMSTSMPVAIIEKGTTSEQRVFVGVLGTMMSLIENNAIKSPSIILVGKVATLHHKFKWIGEGPLKGKKILVTQPSNKASKLSSMLTDLGASVDTVPMIETRPVDPEFTCSDNWAERFFEDALSMENFDTLIFTSATGVETFMASLLEAQLDSRCLGGKKIYVVGPKTGAALLDYGIVADFIPSKYDGEHLVAEAVKEGVLDTSSKVLVIRPKVASPALEDGLKNAGIAFCSLATYETIKLMENIDVEKYDYITFTSNSCIESLTSNNQNKKIIKNLVSKVGGSPSAGPIAVTIGPSTERLAKEKGFNVIVSKKASLESMVEAILERQEQDEQR